TPTDSITNWAFAGISGLTTLAANLVEVSGSNVTVALGSLFNTSVSTFDVKSLDKTGVVSASGSHDGSLLTVELGVIDVSISSALSITGGNLKIASFTLGASSWTAALGDSFTLSLTAGPLSASGTALAFNYNAGATPTDSITNWAFAGISGLTTLAANFIEVSGSNVTVALGSLFNTSVSTFDVKSLDKTGVVSSSGSHDGSLLTVQLSGIDVTISSALSITGGNLKIASFTSGASSWTAALGDSFTLSLTAGPLTASGTGLGFSYNAGATPTDSITNWAFAGITGLTPPHANPIQASGAGVTVALGTFFSTSVTSFDVKSLDKTGVISSSGSHDGSLL